MYRFLVAIGLLVIAAPARADPPDTAPPLRDLCPDRPGLGTPPCTVDAGHVLVEIGAADWTRDDAGPVRTDIVLAGDALVRIGLGGRLEAQFGWTAWGHVRTRDARTGMVDTASGTGDVTLALRRNLHNPDGSGFSIALMPYASLPAGRGPVGAGDWGAGLLVPVSFDLGAVALALTPRVDAAVDSDGKGRHLGYGSVVGIGGNLTKALSATAELSLYRDEDPTGHATEALAGLSLGWQPTDALQFDIGVNIGLSAASPDAQVYVGVARRF